jgi:hypothetical protein
VLTKDNLTFSRLAFLYFYHSFYPVPPLRDIMEVSPQEFKSYRATDRQETYCFKVDKYPPDPPLPLHKHPCNL